MDIREELKEAYLNIVQTDDEAEDVVNFILNKNTLELLRPLYEIQKDNFAQSLSDGDVVGVKKK